MQKEDTNIFYFGKAMTNLWLFVHDKDRTTKQHVTVTQEMHGWGPTHWTVLSHHNKERGFLGRQEKEVSKGKGSGVFWLFSN